MANFAESPYRDEIIKRLQEGVSAASLSKVYPKATVYYLQKQLRASGNMPDSDGDEQDIEPPTIDIPQGNTRKPSSTRAKSSQQTGSSDRTGVIKHIVPETQFQSLLTGETSLPTDPLNAVRGVLGIKLRPKVLECPAPDLLYPAMIISQQEWGWPPMQPQDFIDAVLDKFLSAADIELNVYAKRSQLEEIMRYAELGGYKRNNGGVAVAQNNHGMEEEYDSTEWIARPSGEEGGDITETGGGGENKTGRDISGAGGDGGIPI
jgi:hypothetical protein